MVTTTYSWGVPSDAPKDADSGWVINTITNVAVKCDTCNKSSETPCSRCMTIIKALLRGYRR